jgi:uncharacterized protein YciI
VIIYPQLACLLFASPILPKIFFMSDQTLSPESIMQRVSTGRPYVLLHFIPGKPSPEDQNLVNQMQMEHLARLFTLEAQGHACIFGPVVNNPNLIGMIIFKTTDKELIKALMSDDPYIKDGYLTYELFDFFTIPGQQLS